MVNHDGLIVVFLIIVVGNRKLSIETGSLQLIKPVSGRPSMVYLKTETKDYRNHDTWSITINVSNCAHLTRFFDKG